MGLGRAISRFFRSIMALLTGNVDSATDSLDQNTNVIRAKYDQIIRDKKKNIHKYKEAVAALISQQEKKMRQLENLTSEVEKLENLKTGAAAKAKQVVADLKKQGLNSEQIHHNEDYMRCSTAFNDFSSTLVEKKARIEELESDVNTYAKTIGDHKVQMQGLLRNIDDLKSEAAEAVADIITAKEEKEISDLVTGISDNGMSEDLERLRGLRDRAKAEARVSKELAGTDNKAQEAEFLDYARRDYSNDEFDALIGLEEEAAAESAAPEAESEAGEGKLPE